MPDFQPYDNQQTGTKHNNKIRHSMTMKEYGTPVLDAECGIFYCHAECYYAEWFYSECRYGKRELL